MSRRASLASTSTRSSSTDEMKNLPVIDEYPKPVYKSVSTKKTANTNKSSKIQKLSNFSSKFTLDKNYKTAILTGIGFVILTVCFFGLSDTNSDEVSRSRRIVGGMNWKREQHGIVLIKTNYMKQGTGLRIGTEKWWILIIFPDFFRILRK